METEAAVSTIDFEASATILLILSIIFETSFFILLISSFISFNLSSTEELLLFVSDVNFFNYVFKTAISAILLFTFSSITLISTELDSINSLTFFISLSVYAVFLNI